LLSVEHQKAEGWKIAIAAFLGISGGADSSSTTKEAKAIK
jgi:predicted PP-loop superfamily ATPase